MKNLFTALCLLVCFIVQAKIYYVSPSGNDNAVNNSIITPYKSINKVNAIPFKPGDKVLFQCGGVWHGTIKTHGDGTALNPVTFGCYGTGAYPIITGFSALRTWAYVGNGIYKSGPMAVESPVRMVTINNIVQGQGRYPNADAPDKGYLIYENFGANYIQDQQLSSTPINYKWIGADIAIRTYRGYLDKATLSGINGVNGNLYYTGEKNMSSQPWSGGYGYFITNSIQTLDKFGEWFYNKKDSCLYVYFGAANPHNYDVRATDIDVLLHPQNSYYAFEYMTFDGANKYVIENSWAGVHDLKLGNSAVVHGGINGIALANRHNFYMYNTKVLYCNTNAVMIGYRCDSAYLKSNKIDSAGMIAENLYRDTIYQSRVGFGVFSGDADNVGIKAIGNSITNIGYIPIYLDGSGNDIENNYISNFCMVLDDGGGIYFMNAKAGDYKNNLVNHNVIVHGAGQQVATPNSIDRMVNGVYCDERTTGLTIKDNFIAFNGQDGVFIHNSYNIKVLNNTMAFNGLFAFNIQDAAILPKVNGIVSTGNSMYADTGRQYIYGFYTAGQSIGASGLDSFGVINNNYMYSPVKEAISYVANWAVPYSYFYTLDQIRSNLHYDNATQLVNYPFPYTVFYTDTRPKTFYFKGDYYKDIKGKVYKDSLTLQSCTGAVLFKIPSN